YTLLPFKIKDDDFLVRRRSAFDFKTFAFGKIPLFVNLWFLISFFCLFYKALEKFRNIVQNSKYYFIKKQEILLYLELGQSRNLTISTHNFLHCPGV
ncbi:mCG145143, partial [Mus musculus]